MNQDSDSKRVCLLVGLAVICFAALAGCRSDERSKTTNVQLSQLQPGPIRHDNLSPDLVARISKLHDTFQKVGRNLSIDAKREVYGIVIQRSAAPDEEVLKNLNVKSLSVDDAKAILKLYDTPPAPITVSTSPAP